jgi:TPR repeat protein
MTSNSLRSFCSKLELVTYSSGKSGDTCTFAHDPSRALSPSEVLFRDGQRFYGQQRFSKAEQSWQRAVEQKHGASHAFLSNMLIEGRPGVLPDVRRAFALASTGEKLGCAHSKGALGRCLVTGAGVAKDERRGLEIASESAAEGSCFGQFVVGRCYDYGIAQVEQDHAQAAQLYRLAAAKGHAAAQINLGAMMLEEGNAQDCAEKISKAELLFCRAAKQKNACAEYNLGVMFEDGAGVPQDHAKAEELFRSAATQGHKKASEALKRLEKK